jgi:hypothetical protein
MSPGAADQLADAVELLQPFYLDTDMPMALKQMAAARRFSAPAGVRLEQVRQQR